MGKIVYLMGKSSTGKDSLFQKLSEEGTVALKTIVPYTTRPIRAGEQDGREYFFTDEDGFQDLIKKGKVIEERSYHTCHGIWRYFTVDDGQIQSGEQNYIMIGTLEAYLKMKEYFGEEKLLPVLIELDDGVRLQRALDREKKQEQPKYEELCRRFLADGEDFAEEKIAACGIMKRFYNDNLERCAAEISEYIEQHQKK